MGRIVNYTCNEEKQKPMWGCPKFTDGIKPSSKNSYLAFQHFQYDQMNNIVHIITTSSQKEHVSMVYHYMDDKPTVLDHVTFTRTNMVKVAKEITQRFVYDRCGNVREILTGGVKDYILSYDAIGHTYLSQHNGHIIQKRHDEQGNMFYHRHQKGTNSYEKLLLHDDNSKLRTEWGSREKGSYVYVISGRKVAQLSDRSWKYYCLDAAGSMVSSLGVEDRHHFSYSPFGCNERNTSAEPIGFQNMWTDEDDLIVTENGRTLAPWIGRFLERDQLSPFGEAGIGGYVFADNSPISIGDPTGELPMMLPTVKETVTRAATSATGTAVLPRTAYSRIQAAAETTQMVQPHGVYDRLAPSTAAEAEAAQTRAGGYPFSLRVAQSRSTGMVQVSQVTRETMTRLGGQCTPMAYAGAVEWIAPNHLVSTLELASYGKYKPFQGLRTVMSDDMEGMFTKFGTPNYRLRAPVKAVSNAVPGANRQFHLFQTPTVAHVEQYGRGYPVIMQAKRMFDWQRGVFTDQGHAVAITSSQTYSGGALQGGRLWYNTAKDFMLDTGLQSYFFEPVMPYSLIYRDYEMFALAPI